MVDASKDSKAHTIEVQRKATVVTVDVIVVVMVIVMVVVMVTVAVSAVVSVLVSLLHPRREREVTDAKHTAAK